jgi:tRNA/rRNA methyltransferase
MLLSPLSLIRIVLVEPAGGLNVGSAARVMANMGLNQLVLVNPQCDPLGDEARRMAVHAVAILEQATIVATLPEALAGCVGAIATTARPRDLRTPLELPEVALPWLIREDPGEPVALLFGPEDRGLSNEELNYAQRLVCIPSHPAYPSLNLAQAIAVCCYELNRAVNQRSTPFLELPSPPPDGLAPLDQLEDFYQHWQSVLLKIGYLYPHTVVSRMEKFRRFFLRTTPTQQELAMLRGVLRQVEWAIAQGHPQSSANSSESPPPEQPH